MIKKLAITLALSLLITSSFTMILYSKIASEREVLNKLEEINYYDYAYKDIMSKLEIELPNNELTYVYNKYVTKDRIKKDIKSILDNYYNGENNGIKKEFYNNVIKNFDNKKDENIKSLVNSLANTYYNNLFRIDKLKNILESMPFKNSSKALAIVTLTAMIFLLVLFIRESAIYNSFIVSGLIFLLPKIFIKMSDVIKDFYYFNNNLSYFLKMYAYNVIAIYFRYGVIILVVGIVGFVIHSNVKTID